MARVRIEDSEVSRGLLEEVRVDMVGDMDDVGVRIQLSILEQARLLRGSEGRYYEVGKEGGVERDILPEPHRGSKKRNDCPRAYSNLRYIQRANTSVCYCYVADEIPIGTSHELSTCAGWFLSCT